MMLKGASMAAVQIANSRSRARNEKPVKRRAGSIPAPHHIFFCAQGDSRSVRIHRHQAFRAATARISTSNEARANAATPRIVQAG